MVARLPGSLTYRPWLPIFANPMITSRQRYVGEFRRKERPVLLSGAMVSVILGGRGTTVLSKGHMCWARANATRAY